MPVAFVMLPVYRHRAYHHYPYIYHPHRMLLQHQENNNNLNVRKENKIALKSRWSFPGVNLLRLNTNGSSKGNPSPSSLGGLIRDGLCLIKENMSNLFIETDCEAVMRLGWKEADYDHPFKSIMDDITKMMKEQKCVRLHTRRDGNQVDDIIRPDIVYATGRLSKFTSNPSRKHWQAITRIFKYLRGTKDYGLSYVGYPSVLEGYSDASWINHVEDSSSMSRWVFLLRGGAISCASKNQTCITGSTMEYEFVALAAAGKEEEWLRNLIHEIPIWLKPIAPTSIRCDSAPTMARAYTQIYYGKSRHLGNTSVRCLSGFGLAIPQECIDCGKKYNMGGPIWSAPIHDQDWVTSNLADVKSIKERYPAFDRISAVLTTISEELRDVPLFPSLHNLYATLKCISPFVVIFRSIVINAGYRISGTHVHPLGLKSDAPIGVKNKPVKSHPPKDSGSVILVKEPVLHASFARVVASLSKAHAKKDLLGSSLSKELLLLWDIEEEVGDEMAFHSADIMNVTHELKGYDVIFLAAVVGMNIADKNKVIQHLAKYMAPGAILMLRSAHGARAFLYIVVDPNVLHGFSVLMIFHLDDDENYAKENETWDWKEYIRVHINDESDWTDFKIENLKVTSEHHDQGTQPVKENNEFPNNDDDGYASPTTDSFLHSQTSHTPSTSSSQVNSQITPNISTQSIYQGDSDLTSTINSHSHFDHTPLRVFRTLDDLYENSEELLLAENEPRNYKEASSDQKWIEAMKVELHSINRNNT
nr:tRNA (guanine(26)-N(2))-dimethyltransferase [Tanacetum cinerariifolium]